MPGPEVQAPGCLLPWLSSCRISSRMRNARKLGLALGAVFAFAALPARAQVTPAAGDIVDINNIPGTIHIGSSACSATAGATDELYWTVTGGTVTNGVFTMSASDTQTSTTSTTGTSGVVVCPTTSSTTNGTVTTAAQVPDSSGTLNILGNEGNSTFQDTFDTYQFVNAAGFASTCSTTSTFQIYLCVNFFPYVSGTTISGTPTAYATGTITRVDDSPRAAHGVDPRRSRRYSSLRLVGAALV